MQSKLRVSRKVLAIVATLSAFSVVSAEVKWEDAKSIYEFTAKDIYGNDVSLEKYKGHVCIIVNVASECGFTDVNYEQLNYLYDRYGKSKGLRILGFPSNEFGGQEPGTNEDIINFAKFRGIKFDLFSKVNVNGDDAHPLWKYLKAKQGGYFGDFIKWNFTKFIVDKKGQVRERFATTTNPNDMVEYLEKYFDEKVDSEDDTKKEL